MLMDAVCAESGIFMNEFIRSVYDCISADDLYKNQNIFSKHANISPEIPTIYIEDATKYFTKGGPIRAIHRRQPDYHLVPPAE